jgi:hypothetical protein
MELRAGFDPESGTTGLETEALGPAWQDGA